MKSPIISTTSIEHSKVERPDLAGISSIEVREALQEAEHCMEQHAKGSPVWCTAFESAREARGVLIDRGLRYYLPPQLNGEGQMLNELEIIGNTETKPLRDIPMGTVFRKRRGDVTYRNTGTTRKGAEEIAVSAMADGRLNWLAADTEVVSAKSLKMIVEF